MKPGTFILSVLLASASALGQTGPQEGSSAQDRTATSGKQDQSGTNRSSQSEMQTQTYKGVLVNARCAQPSGSNAPAISSMGASATSGNSADRSSDASCSVSSSTNELALKMNDGRTLRFDSVGNVRGQDALRNNKKWAEAASSGKPIQATVHGAVSGDKLIVMSVK